MTVSTNLSNFAMQEFHYFSRITLFLMLGVYSSGCFDPTIPQEDDATPYIVNFTLSKPTATTFSKNQYIPIEVRFVRNPSGYIHNVKIEIMDDKGVLVEKILERYVNTFKTYTYSNSTAFKPLSTGSFKIKASSTSETGKQENTKEFSFTVE